MRFSPDGSEWKDVVSSVYSGIFNAKIPKTEDNIMLNQLSAPYPDRDYMCVVDMCYTLESVSYTHLTLPTKA